MRFRGRFANWLTGVIGTAVVRAWIGGLRSSDLFEEPEIHPVRRTEEGGCIFVLWHNVLLLPTYLYCRSHQFTLISQSDDGEIINSIVQRLGWQTVRGSSTRGGMTALRELLELRRTRKRMDICITADGPRGPARELKEGFVYLASKTGLPVACVGVAHDRPWHARSWDRFTLPRPFSRAQVVVGKRIAIPSDLSRAELQRYRDHIQIEMERVERVAQSRLHHRLSLRSPATPIRKAA